MSETYRIKPLVWADAGVVGLRAKTMFGRCIVRDWGNGLIVFDGPGGSDYSEHKTIESAKAAAESWYRSKLLEALEEVK